ncbi:hypothetical protein, partial [Nocardiopsis prasina]
LPFASDAAPAAGYDTEIALVLRDADAAARLRELLEATTPALLLALADLAEIRVCTDTGERILTREPGPGEDVLTRVEHRAPRSGAPAAQEPSGSSDAHTVRW